MMVIIPLHAKPCANKVVALGMFHDGHQTVGKSGGETGAQYLDVFFAVIHSLGGKRGEALFVGVEHLFH